MPEMELLDADLQIELDGRPATLSLIPGVWLRLQSYMYWPADERQRKAYCAKPMGEALAWIERQIAADLDYSDDHDVVYHAFRQKGGWSVLDEVSFSPEHHRPLQTTLRTAAAVLDIIRKSPGGTGSLNRAVHVIEATAKTYALIRNRTGILQAWRSHRSVAHLGVALIGLGILRKPSEFDGPGLLGRFVAVARDYQAFAISYKPPKQKRPLIADTEIWSIPKDLKTPFRLKPPLSPLPADMLAAHRTYRAPTIGRRG
jgi:hypothetical protein